MKVLLVAVLVLAFAPAAFGEPRGEAKNEFPFVGQLAAAQVATPPVVPAPEPVPAPAPEPPAAPAPAHRTARGVFFECNRTPSERVMPQLAGLEVRLQIFVEELALPGYLDALDRCIAQNPTLLVVNTYTPATPDVAAVADAVRLMAARPLLGIEVLNEEQATLSPGEYGRVLCAAYAAAAGRVPVVSAGTAYVPLDWLAGLPAGCMDAVAVHPYAPGLTAPAPAGLEQLAQVHALTGKPVWVTEIGWSLPDAEQAEQTRAALAYLDALPFVAHVFFFQAYPSWFDGGLWDETSLLRVGSYEARPALSVLKG